MKDFDKTLLNLKIISKIQEDTKLKRVNDGILDLERINIYTSMRRFMNNESRHTNIENINDVINSIIQTCDNILNSRIFSKKVINIEDSFILSKIDDEYINNYKTLKLIYDDLLLIPDSLSNLKKIYFDDKKTCSNIDMIISKIIIYKEKLERLLKPNGIYE